MRILILQLLLICLYSSQFFGQLKEANDLFDNFEYREAIKYYNKVDSLSDEEQIKFAYCYFRIHDFLNAEKQFALVVNVEDISPMNYHYYGVCLKNNGKFDQARDWFLKYKELDSLDYFNNLSLSELDFQKSQYGIKERLELTNLGTINSGLSEFCPRYYKNGFMYCDEVKFDEDNKRPHIDYGNDSIDIESLEYGSAERPLAELYFVPITGDMHGQPVLIAEDEHFHIGDFDIDEVNGEIYFTKVDVLNRWNPDARSHPRLFKGKLDTVNKKLVDVQRVKIKKLHNEDGSGHPALTENGLKMYFSSDRPGGEGGSDLYYVEKLPNGNWDAPVNLGPEVNSPGDELFPYLYNDSTLYFSSNGHIGFGELDLFKVIVIDAVAKNREILPRPLNSEADDIGLLISRDNPDEGFVVSNRYHGGYGDDDMFKFSLKLDDSYVKGIVVDQQGSAVANALVKLLDENGKEIEQLRTGEDGTYLFDIDTNKTYRLVATTNGFAAKKDIVTDENWQSEQSIELQLEPTPTAQGFVRMETGSVVKDAEVALYDSDRKLMVITKTDDEGRYQVALDENKSYTIVARIDGFQGEQEVVTDDSWDTNGDTDITLLPTETVQGVITDSLGNPVAGALVKLLDTNGVEVGQVKTDSNGYYIFSVPPGDYELVASTIGLGARKKIAIDENWDGEQFVNMTLLPSDTVQGLVMNEDGTPASNTMITLYDDQGNVLVQSWTDDEGRYQFLLEEDKTYDVVAQKGNLKGNAHIVTDDNWDTTKSTDIKLTDSTFVSGTIYDSDGKPVNGATVKLYDDEGNLIATFTTGADGKYNFVLDKDENYQIVASVDGFDGIANIFTGDNWDGTRSIDIDLQPSGVPADGFVKSKADGKGLDKVKVTLIDNETEQKLVVFTDGEGRFSVPMTPGKKYTLNLEKEGYYPKSIQVNSKDGLGNIDLNRDHDLSMDYAGYAVDKIYFDYNKSSLTKGSKDQLDKLVVKLNENKDARLYIKSYTDCRGPDKYNESLSWKRSKAVKEYLVDKGIAAIRIGTKSMGATNFVNNCYKPEDCTEEEHAVNRRSEFEIKYK